MDPGHHTAFLLAILLCILLLLLAVSALLMCFWRRNGFKMSNRTSSMRFGRPVRDQATSMTSFTLNTINPNHYLLNDPEESQAFSLPITADRSSQKSKSVTSRLSRDSHIMSISDEEEGSRTSIVDKPVRKKSKVSEHYSTLQRMLSGASIFGEVLEKSSMFSLKAKRRSSSLKSGVDADISMIPLESPVHVSSKNADQFHSVGSPRNLSRSSTLLCENSSEQQFTWDTAGLSVLSRQVRHKESFSLPNTLERKTEEESSKQNTQLEKQDFLKPKAWFVFMGNRPVSEGAQLENELNNVTSLDSGVDVIEPAVRNGFGGLKVAQMPIFSQDTKCHIQSRSNENPEENNGDNEKQDEGLELHMSHREAARKLNSRNCSRSLWEKREERPLIGVN